jgi:hypothetical protein
LNRQIIRPQKNDQRIRQSIYLSYNRPDILVAAIPDLSFASVFSIILFCRYFCINQTTRITVCGVPDGFLAE